MRHLSHVDSEGKPTMVDVSGKPQSIRTARAEGFIRLSKETLELIASGGIEKGNVLTVAEIAGVQAAKRTAELIPLCHILPVETIKVRAEAEDEGVRIASDVRYVGRTGVEMEALTAVSVALLTVYDMCKAVDSSMVIGQVRLIEKAKEEVQ